MPNLERSDGTPDEGSPVNPLESFAIIVTPHDGEGAVFDTLPDGRPRMTLSGEVTMFPLPHPAEDRGSLPLADFAEALTGQSRVRHAATSVSKDGAKSNEASESSVTAAESARSIASLDDTSAPLREPHRPSETHLHKQSAPVEDEANRKFIFSGRLANTPYYRERRSGTKIADFVLAEQPEDQVDDKPLYRRIRAFDKQAEKAKTHLDKGLQVEVTAYGPKTWEDRVKDKDGTWSKRQRTGYYAGFIEIPKEKPNK